MVTETANGSTSTVEVATVGSGQTVTVGAGQKRPGHHHRHLHLPDRFVDGHQDHRRRSGGPAGSGDHQGQLRRDGALARADSRRRSAGWGPRPDLLRHPGRLDVQRRRDRRRDTSTVDVVISGDNGTSVTVPAGGTATLHITDTYTHATGSLVVSKLVAGPAAGNQGEVTITVSCGGTALADFVVPAGADAAHSTGLQRHRGRLDLHR